MKSVMRPIMCKLSALEKETQISCRDHLADNSAAPTIYALYQNWLDQRKKKDTKNAPERLFIVHAVLFFAACRKSRMVDHALIAREPTWGRFQVLTITHLRRLQIGRCRDRSELNIRAPCTMW
jgi:hypothetical protein